MSNIKLQTGVRLSIIWRKLKPHLFVRRDFRTASRRLLRIERCKEPLLTVSGRKYSIGDLSWVVNGYRLEVVVPAIFRGMEVLVRLVK